MNDAAPNCRRRQSLVSWGGALLGILLFGSLLYYGGVTTLHRLADANHIYLVGTAGAIALLTGLTSARWGLVARAVKLRVTISWLDFYYYSMIGRVTSLFVPKSIGDLGARPAALIALGSFPLGDALYSSVLDRLFDVLMLCLFLVPGMLYVARAVPASAAVGMLILSLTAGWFGLRFHYETLLRGGRRLVAAAIRASRRLPLLHRMTTSGRTWGGLRQWEPATLPVSVVTQSYCLTVARYLAMAVRSYCVVLAFDLTVPFITILFSVAVLQLSQLVSIAPGGLGTDDLSWYGVMVAAGLSQDDALLFLVGHRAYTYVSVLALAMISHVIFLLLRRRASQVRG